LQRGPAARGTGSGIAIYGFVQQRTGECLTHRTILLSPSNQGLNKDSMSGAPQYESASLLHAKCKNDNFVVFFTFRSMIKPNDGAVIVAFRPVRDDCVIVDVKSEAV
jgi:hypothetical protein